MSNNAIVDVQVLRDLVDFYNETNDYKINLHEAMALCQLGKRLMADLWNLLSPHSPDEIAHYYKLCPYSPFELAYANSNEGNMRFRKKVKSLASGRVLDYGGGDGSLSLDIAKRGAKVTYVDVESVNMKFAKWRFNKSESDIEVLDAFKDQDLIWHKQYDLIICIEIIEHVVDPEKLIKSLIKCLKPQGRLIITRLECPGPTADLPLHFKLPFDGKMLLKTEGLEEQPGAFEGDRSLWFKPNN